MRREISVPTLIFPGNGKTDSRVYPTTEESVLENPPDETVVLSSRADAVHMDVTFTIPQHTLAKFPNRAKSWVDDGSQHLMRLRDVTGENDDFRGIDKATVEFSALETLCYQSSLQDGILPVSVIRRGQISRSGSVSWKTRSRNVDTDTYLFQEGLVEFPAGVAKSEILLKLVDNTEWSPDEHLEVHLFNPSENLVFVDELTYTTVVILNDDKFPHGLNPNQMKKDKQGVLTDEFEHGQINILFHFLMHNYDLFRTETHKALLLLVYPSVSWSIETFIVWFVISLSTVVGTGPIYKAHEAQGLNKYENIDMSARALLILLGIIWFVNTLIEQHLNHCLAELRLGGKAKKKLRSAILSMSLELTEKNAENFSSGRVSSIVDAQVSEAVHKGWLAAFHVYMSILKCLMGIAWVVFLVWMSKTYSVLTIPVLIFFVDAVIFILRNQTQAELTFSALEAGEAWSDFFTQSSDLRELTFVYRQGVSICQEFEKIHQNCNRACFSASKFKRVTLDLTAYTPTIITALYISFAWMDDISTTGNGSNKVTSVAFLVTILKVVRSFDKTINEIFATVFTFSEAVASIRQIAELLNTDTRHQQLYRDTERQALLLKAAEASDDRALNPPGDGLVVRNLIYRYNNGPIIIPSCNFSMEPSVIVAVDSKKTGTGKYTLMKLLGRSILPVNGFISYPARWHVRILNAAPLLFDDTVLFNLTFGCTFKHPLQEIVSLCKRIGLSRYLIDDLDKIDVGRMGEKLASSDRVIITVVRALLSNVDFLIIFNTLDTLGEDAGDTVMEILGEFVEKRGLLELKKHYDATPISLKEKKTIVCATKIKKIRDKADYIMNLEIVRDDNSKEGTENMLISTVSSSPT